MKEIRYFNLKDLGPTSKTFSVIWATADFRFNETASTRAESDRILIPSSNKHLIGITLC